MATFCMAVAARVWLQSDQVELKSSSGGLRNTKGLGLQSDQVELKSRRWAHRMRCARWLQSDQVELKCRKKHPPTPSACRFNRTRWN